jgi:glycosyltransferase involved in cell wall biosynthesis
LKGYAEAGHRVYFLNIRKKENYDHLPYELHPNIILYRCQYIPNRLRPFWIRLRNLLHTLEKLSNKFSIKTQSKAPSDSSLVCNPEPKNYIPASPEFKVNYLLDKISWFMFQILGLYWGYRIVRREKINVIYGYEAYGAPIGWFLGKLFGLPVITRYQGTFLKPVLDQKKGYLYPELILAMKLPVNLVVMGNDGTKGDEVLKALGVEGSKILFIKNGVNKNLYDPNFDIPSFKSRLGLSQSARILLTLSKLAYWKRVDKAIKALPEVLSKFKNIVLIIVGDGSERANLERLSEYLGVKSHIRFIGAMPHNEVKDYLHAADIFLSLYDLSNLGNPLLEAMVCGKCIVTLADDSIDGLIEHGKTGMLVKPSRITEYLPKAIIKLLQDDQLRVSYGNAVRDFAQANLQSWNERMALEVTAVEDLVYNFKPR